MSYLRLPGQISHAGTVYPPPLPSDQTPPLPPISFSLLPFPLVQYSWGTKKSHIIKAVMLWFYFSFSVLWVVTLVKQILS